MQGAYAYRLAPIFARYRGLHELAQQHRIEIDQLTPVHCVFRLWQDWTMALSAHGLDG